MVYTDGMAEFSRFDTDPAALAWARGKVEQLAEKYAGFEQASSTQPAADKWRAVVYILRRDLIGGEGCTIAAFDRRMPTIAAALARSEPA